MDYKRLNREQKEARILRPSATTQILEDACGEFSGGMNGLSRTNSPAIGGRIHDSAEYGNFDGVKEELFKDGGLVNAPDPV